MVAVVSASPENWVKPWCDARNIQCLATRLEVIDQKISGNIHGENCYGEEKVRRIKEAFRLEAYQRIIAYGDSRGDKEMLELADEKHFGAICTTA
jgi:HAD superfamily phosphoserine phosphatase-like hydrolase